MTLVATLLGDAVPGATIAVLRDGMCRVHAGIGSSDLSGAPIDRDARFYIYSVTKPLIATAVLQAVESGSIVLDERVQSYLPDYPLEKPVTIRQLLNHTGGLSDYGALAEYNADLRADPTIPWTDDTFLERTLARGWKFEPGTSWAYSNVGYLILRMMLEHIHAAPLRDILHGAIFAPLELHSTYVAESLTDAADLTPGYSRFFSQSDQLENAIPHYHPGWVSHGVVISTALELATMVDALFAGTLLNASSLSSMTEPIILPFEHPLFSQPAYGLGLMLDAKTPHRLVAGHGGGGPGYSIGGLHVVDKDGGRVTSVALANGDAGDIGLRIAFELARSADLPRT